MTTNTDLVKSSALLAMPSTKNEAGTVLLKYSAIATLMALIPGSILFPILGFLIVGGYLKVKS